MADVISLRAGDAEATVAPSIGANCCSFRIGGRDLLEAPPSLDALAARPNGYGCPILFPFPGQLEPGRRRLLGRDVSVEEVRPVVVRHLGEVFDLAFEPSPSDILAGFRSADVA